MGEYVREQRNQLSRAIANSETGSKQLKEIDNYIESYGMQENMDLVRIVNIGIHNFGTIQRVNENDYDFPIDLRKYFNEVANVILRINPQLDLQTVDKDKMDAIIFKWPFNIISDIKWDISIFDDNTWKYLAGFIRVFFVEDNTENRKRWKYADSDIRRNVIEKLTGETKELAMQGLDLLAPCIHRVYIGNAYEKDPENAPAINGTNCPSYIWKYDPSMPNGSIQGDGMFTAQTEIAVSHPVYDVNFIQTMEYWKQQGNTPIWLDDYLYILNVLFSKHWFVAMSDIMRLIILYYKGGLYLDMKIPVDNGILELFSVHDNELATAPNGENWALLAKRGSSLINEILVCCLDRIKKYYLADELQQLPEDEVGKKSSEEHVVFHEYFGPFSFMRDLRNPITSEHSNIGLPKGNLRPNSWSGAVTDKSLLYQILERGDNR